MLLVIELSNNYDVQKKNYKEILSSIKPTPLAQLNHINRDLFAKLEYLNPSGSLKWRASVYMVAKAMERGMLNGSETIIEPTSGQTGLALAELGRILGYPVEVVVSYLVSDETKKTLREMGTILHEVTDDLCPRIFIDKKTGEMKKVENEESDPNLIRATRTDQAIGLVNSIIASAENRRKKGLDAKKYFRPDQYGNQDNVLAHYETTGPETWKQTNGGLDFFSAGIGTGGTITGVGKYLKEKNPDIKIIGVTPSEEKHVIQGLRNIKVSMIPRILDMDIVDEWIEVSNKDTLDMVRRIGREENLYVGPSSGAVLHAADKYQEEQGGKGVVIFGDSGERYRKLYLSHNVFTPDEIDHLEKVLYDPLQ